MSARVVIAVLLVCSGAAAQEHFYAWHDEAGTLHVTNQVATEPRAPRDATTPAQAGAEAPAAESEHVGSTAPPSDPVRAELVRREARLATREAHLELLRAARDPNDPDRLRLENELEDEVRAETEAVASLRRALEERTP